MHALRRTLPLAAALAACSPDLGTGADPLPLAEVAGEYRLCRLRFTPVATSLPAADLLDATIDAHPPAGKPAPTLRVSAGAPEFVLAYTRADGVERRVEGDLELGSGSVFLYLTSRVPTIVVQEALLPPAHLDLVFDAPSRTLTAGDEVSSYFVRRSDYARAAGMPEEGLQDRIRGHVSAAFAAGGCQ